MKKIFVSLLCFLPLLFSLGFGENSGNGVEVRSTSPEAMEIEPGRIVTGSFVIFNNTKGEEEFVQTLTLPPGWEEIVSDEFPLRLYPDEQQIRVIAFLVPQASPAGNYQISYSVRSQRDYSIADSDSISVVVLPKASLQILVEKRPQIVLAGETYEIKFRLVNKGNDRNQLKLTTKSNPAYPLEVEPSEITLERGKSQIIIAKIKTDEKLKQRIKNFVEIKAETEKLKEGDVLASQTVSVEILPRVTGEFDPYHKLPAKATLISAGRKGKGGFQAELSGRGSLDEKGKRRIDFLFRGPDIQDVSRWGKRDEYRLSYRQEYFDLHFGDRSYSLSPLTQRFSYGRGIEANIRPGNFGLGAFYSKNRWGKPKGEAAGTYLEYRFNDKFGIKANFLSKKKGSTYSFEGYDEEIYSLQATIKPVETLILDLEAGLCEGDRENKFGELAFRMDLRGRLSNQIRYSLEKIYADPNYFGYYKDVDYTTGTITFPIYQKLGGDLSFRTYENNLDLDSTKGIANQEKSYQAGIFYSFPFGTHLSLKYEDLTREDCAFPPNFRYEEKALKLGLNQSFGKFSLSTHMERGEFEDKLLARKNHNLQRYNLYVSYRLSPRQSFSLFTRIGHSSFTQQPEWTKSAGISTRWNIKDNISFSLNYRKDKSGSETNGERDDLFSTFAYNLKNNHALVLRTDWSKQEHRKGEFSFLLTYTIPLKVPVGKKESIGVLKGKVYDQEKTTRPPLPGVILTADGATAISNRDGDFIFPSLEPGTYYLRAEKSSIGLDRIATRKLPILVGVEGGKTTDIEIGVVTSCKIFGRVAAFTPDWDKDFGSQDTSIILGSASPSRGVGKNFHPVLKQSAQSKTILKTKETISVSPDVSFVIRCFKGSEKREYFSGKEVFLKANSDGIILSGEGEVRLEEKIERVLFIPEDKKSSFSLNEKDYRGILEVIFVAKDSSLLALNKLEKEAISVSPSSSFLIRCFKGSEKREYFSGKEVFLKVNSDGIILSEGEEKKLEDRIERVLFIPEDKKSCFSLNGKDYSGILEIIFISKDSSLLALNRLWKEEYAEGTIPLGMGNQIISDFEAEKPKRVAASNESQSFINPDKKEKSEKDDLRKGKGLGNTLVEITKGEEVLHQLTDEKGRFSFEDLRPGKWTLKVDDQDLPLHHYLDQEEFHMELKPGEEKEITVKVLPRHRPIQIIDQGKIKSENK